MKCKFKHSIQNKRGEKNTALSCIFMHYTTLKFGPSLSYRLLQTKNYAQISWSCCNPNWHSREKSKIDESLKKIRRMLRCCAPVARLEAVRFNATHATTEGYLSYQTKLGRSNKTAKCAAFRPELVLFLLNLNLSLERRKECPLLFIYTFKINPSKRFPVV